MDAHIRELVGKLVAGAGPKLGVVRVWAYGSRVRGDYEPGSDLDLLVELREVTPAARQAIWDRAWELSLEAGYVISVAVVSQEAFEQGPLSVSGYAENVRREGVEIAA
jgi:predicted nucleotidyltransferase